MCLTYWRLHRRVAHVRMNTYTGSVDRRLFAKPIVYGTMAGNQASENINFPGAMSENSEHVGQIACLPPGETPTAGLVPLAVAEGWRWGALHRVFHVFMATPSKWW